MKLLRFAIDIDGVLCEEGHWKNYAEVIPIPKVAEKVNYLYSLGHHITLYTSRYSDDQKVTEGWLKENGINYHEIIYSKTQADYYIDDRALPIEKFLEIDFIS